MRMMLTRRLLLTPPRPCSNFGRRSVQLAAPGTGILSTVLPGYSSKNYDCDEEPKNCCSPKDLYCYEDGTSMAAPFVTGAASLALTASGGKLTNVQVGVASGLVA